MPSISIVICTYNDSQFLPTAINSCMSQDIDKEIILVDDCSSKPMTSEATAAIINSGAKVVRHSENRGLSAARNTGISEANSEWVVPLDADDWFYPNSLKTLWDNRNEVDIVTGNCTDSGHIYAPAISSGPLSKVVFIRENPLICSSLFTKDIWRKAGGYTVRNGPHYEDWNFWAKCFTKDARFRYLNFNVYNHTSRADSMLRILHPNRDTFIKLATEGVF